MSRSAVNQLSLINDSSLSPGTHRHRSGCQPNNPHPHGPTHFLCASSSLSHSRAQRPTPFGSPGVRPALSRRASLLSPLIFRVLSEGFFIPSRVFTMTRCRLICGECGPTGIKGGTSPNIVMAWIVFSKHDSGPTWPAVVGARGGRAVHHLKELRGHLSRPGIGPSDPDSTGQHDVKNSA